MKVRYRLCCALVLACWALLTAPKPAHACESHICYNYGAYTTCCTLQPYTGGGCAYGGCYTYACDFTSSDAPMCTEYHRTESLSSESRPLERRHSAGGINLRRTGEERKVKKQQKKLSLHRETISNLNDSVLRQAQGGANSDSCSKFETWCATECTEILK